MGSSDERPQHWGMRGNATLTSVLAIFAGIVIVMNLFKVSASLSLLTADLGIDPSAGSWLVTACTLVAVAIVLPAGGLVDRFGPKRVGLFGLACAALGSTAGAFCTELGPLLASRAVEGIGYGLIGVVSPALIAQVFPPEKRGAPMAIWSCWMDLGMLAVLNVANFFVDPAVVTSWTYLWWVCTGLIVAVAIAFAIAVKEPARSRVERGTSKPSVVEGLKSPSTWIVSSVFLLYNIGVLSFLTLAPLYCQMQFDLDIVEANSYTSLLTMAMISGAFAMGFVLSRIRTLKGRVVLLSASMVLAAAAMGWAYLYAFDQIVPFMVLGGLALAVMPAVGFTVVPETASSPAFAGTAIGLFMLMGNLAGFGTPVIGAMMEGSPATLATLLVAVNLAGALLSLLLMKTTKRL